jgi:hypothetical protein
MLSLLSCILFQSKFGSSERFACSSNWLLDLKDIRSFVRNRQCFRNLLICAFENFIKEIFLQVHTYCESCKLRNCPRLIVCVMCTCLRARFLRVVICDPPTVFRRQTTLVNVLNRPTLIYIHMYVCMYICIIAYVCMYVH